MYRDEEYNKPGLVSPLLLTSLRLKAGSRIPPLSEADSMFLEQEHQLQ